jgi:hypothetical protein
MTNQNLIHIKLDYSEALEAKKDILYSQKSLIDIAKIMKQYHSLRNEELKTKLKIHRKIKEIITNINKLEKTLPAMEIQKPKTKAERIKSKAKPKEDDLEAQLREIQNRLRALE